jgi:hypothetical protein
MKSQPDMRHLAVGNLLTRLSVKRFRSFDQDIFKIWEEIEDLSQGKVIDGEDSWVEKALCVC